MERIYKSKGMSINLKDSELYDILLEVCEEIGYDQYMPGPGSLL